MDREAITAAVEVFDALDAVLDRACELSFDALTVRELVAMLEPANNPGAE